MIVEGLEYVPTGDACQRLDIGHETLRNWYAPRRGGTPLVRLLRDPAGRPVRLHRQLLVCWPDTVEAEHATRRRPRRPRAGLTPAQTRPGTPAAPPGPGTPAA